MSAWDSKENDFVILCLLLKSALDFIQHRFFIRFSYFSAVKALLDSSLQGKVLLRIADPSAPKYQLDLNAALPSVLGRSRVCCEGLLCCGIYLFI